MLEEVAQSQPASATAWWQIFAVGAGLIGVICTYLDGARNAWGFARWLWKPVRGTAWAVFEWLRVPWSVPKLRHEVAELRGEIAKLRRERAQSAVATIQHGDFIWRLGAIDQQAEPFCLPCSTNTGKLHKLIATDVTPDSPDRAHLSVQRTRFQCPEVGGHQWHMRGGDLHHETRVVTDRLKGKTTPT